MREKRRFVVFAFASTHDALQAEDVLQAVDIPVRVIPKPTAIGGAAECGIAVRVPQEDAERARGVLAGGGVVPSAQIQITDY